jgi:RNA polymerase sigma factor (TIGR02999 family)
MCEVQEVEAFTDVLLRCQQGDDEAFQRLVTMVYDDLRRTARRKRRAGPPSPNLDTTELVHETYLRLVDQTRVGWQDRAHFMAIAARAMRFILIDYARSRTASKRGGGKPDLPIADDLDGCSRDAEAILDLDLALDRLAAHDRRLVQVVECRYFAGFSSEETAEVLGISTKTVQRDWKRAIGWLNVELPGPSGRAT